MKASETKLLRLLEGNKQFKIPIYQRTYSWNTKHCNQLWEDIKQTTGDPDNSGHFVGSVVYIESGLYQATGVSELLVIDGQQRLTTVSLLLAALAEHVDDPEVDSKVTSKRIRNNYLLNSLEEDDALFKLLLTQNDKDTLQRLVQGLEPLENSPPRLVENYQFFQQILQEGDLTPDEIFQGIGNLLVVDVALDRRYDNPQLIFESLNSTGLDLSQADLIRNYVLMGLVPTEQTALYKNYWFPMERSFGHGDYAKQFDRFMRDYLTIKSLGIIPKIDDVYWEFKNYVQRSKLEMDDIVEEIVRYSGYWVKLAIPRNEEDREIRDAFADIQTLRVEVAYPFLIEMYDAYSGQQLSRENFLKILRHVEAYVFRRAICGIPANSLGRTFSTLSGELNRENYSESLAATFLLFEGYRRMPDDDEFKQQLLIKDIYNFRNRSFLLKKLENHGRKESASIDDYTIEHIMPQNPNLSDEWREDLGESWSEVWSKYLHTLGNLTLTGYNSELSDSSFQVKRDMDGGFKKSPLRLNRSLAELEYWNSDAIQQRADELSGMATEVWPLPALSNDILEHYKNPSGLASETKTSLSNIADDIGADKEALLSNLRKRVLNLDSSVKEHVNDDYIEYRTITNFVDVVPEPSALKLYLNLPFHALDDPDQLCKDVTLSNHLGQGDVEVSLSVDSAMDDVLYLVLQAFDYQGEEANV